MPPSLQSLVVSSRRARPVGHVEHAKQPHSAARQRDSGDIAGTDAERAALPTGDASDTSRGAESAARRPTSANSIVSPASSATRTVDPRPAAPSASRRQRRRMPTARELLELSDSRLVDGGILESSEPVVVISGASEVAGVAKPLGQLAAVSTAQFVELSHELGVVRRAELHPCRQRRRHG